MQTFEFEFISKNKQYIPPESIHRIKFSINPIAQPFNVYVCGFSFLEGHGIWLSRYENIIFFNIPESDGHVISPVLAGFYMFWTMIILLQVISIELIVKFQKLTTTPITYSFSLIPVVYCNALKLVCIFLGFDSHFPVCFHRNCEARTNIFYSK